MTEWKVQVFESGTIIVTSELPEYPWLDVYGPGDEGDGYGNRYAMAKDLARVMNERRKPR